MSEPPTSIRDVIDAAGQPGHGHCKAVLGTVAPWLSAQAEMHGLRISGFVITIDTSAIRHILDHHGDHTNEAKRGHIPVTHADFESIPDLLMSPDSVVFGARTKRQLALIAFFKRFSDGVTLYLVEVRSGRKEIAAVSMRRYPATIDANRLAANFNLYGRTDGEDKVYIVEVPEKVTAILPREISPGVSNAAEGSKVSVGRAQSSPTWHRVRKFSPPVLGLVVLAAIGVGLHRALKRVTFSDVATALAATTRAELVHAAGLLAVSFCIMAVYDIPGILFAKKLIDFPRMGLRRVGLASFCAYALSHVVGAPALVAAAVRLRLYAQWGVPPAGIARIMTLSGTMFSLGLCALLGGILVLHPIDVPLFGHDLPPAAMRGVGLVMWGVIAGYIVAARKTVPLVVLGRNIPRPGWGLAITQVALSCADTGTACAILYVLLPTTPGLTYAHVLALYLAAFAGGLVSGLPGGVGVFDTVLLLGLSGYMETANAIGAILLFRVVYYLVPAGLAAICFAGHELWITYKRK